MIITFNVHVVDCVLRSEDESERDSKAMPYTGSITIKREKKSKTGVKFILDDVQSYKSCEKLTAGDHMVEADLSAYSVNGNTGISIKILRTLKKN